MGLKEVKDGILQDAREEADRIVEEAEQEKKEIVEDAEKEAEKIREETEEEIDEEKQSLERRRLSNARMKAKQRKLEAKQEKIDESFNQFRQRLKQLDDSDKEVFVESCVEKVGFEIGEVQASEEFQDAVKAQGYHSKELDSGEGIVLFSADGEKSQTFTLDKIIENYRDNHRKEVADTLF